MWNGTGKFAEKPPSFASSSAKESLLKKGAAFSRHGLPILLLLNVLHRVFFDCPAFIDAGCRSILKGGSRAMCKEELPRESFPCNDVFSSRRCAERGARRTSIRLTLRRHEQLFLFVSHRFFPGCTSNRSAPRRQGSWSHLSPAARQLRFFLRLVAALRVTLLPGLSCH